MSEKNVAPVGRFSVRDRAFTTAMRMDDSLSDGVERK